MSAHFAGNVSLLAVQRFGFDHIFDPVFVCQYVPTDCKLLFMMDWRYSALFQGVWRASNSFHSRKLGCKSRDTPLTSKGCADPFHSPEGSAILHDFTLRAVSNQLSVDGLNPMPQAQVTTSITLDWRNVS